MMKSASALRSSGLILIALAICLRAAPARGEPSLTETLCDMNFAITGECGIGYQEIICTRPDGINCFVVMPPGPYKLTLLAEHSGSHASLELSAFTNYETPVIGPLLFSGPTGNQGETNPRVEKFLIVDQEIGFTLDAPDDRFYSVNFLNPDTIPFDLSPSVVLESIVSSEPDNGIGDGNTTGDIQSAAFGTEDLQFEVRAERAGPGDGRTYTVTYTVTDDCGNAASASADVFVPHSKKKK